MATFTHFKTEIQKFVGPTTIEDASLIDSQLDDLLSDTELMAFIDRLCRKHDATMPIYISFIIRSLNAAYHPSYPANLEQADREFKSQARGIRDQYGDTRPSLVEFLGMIRDYASTNHPGRI